MGNFAENLNLGNRFRPPLYNCRQVTDGSLKKKKNLLKQAGTVPQRKENWENMGYFHIKLFYKISLF